MDDARETNGTLWSEAWRQTGLGDLFSPERTTSAMREIFQRLGPIAEVEPPPVEQVADPSLPGGDGDRRARVYIPHGAPARGPALLFFHGGGYTVGSVEGYDPLCQRLAAVSGVRIVSLDYRLAPEHVFPAAVEDAQAAFDALRGGALSEFGVDKKQLAVGGDSAGGGLAAGLAQTRRRDIRFQLLIYPLLQLTDSKQKRRVVEGPLLSNETIARIRKLYLPNKADALDPRASPLLEPNLNGVPPAFMLTAQFDPLTDEGTAYCDKLAAFGVRCERAVYEGVPHGFLSFTRLIPKAIPAIEACGKALADALAQEPAAS